MSTSTASEVAEVGSVDVAAALSYGVAAALQWNLNVIVVDEVAVFSTEPPDEPLLEVSSAAALTRLSRRSPPALGKLRVIGLTPAQPPVCCVLLSWTTRRRAW